MIDKVIGHFEEQSGNKYLVLDDVNENKEVSKNMKKFGKVLTKKLKQLMVVKKVNTKKIRFESNDNFPLNKPIKLHLLTIIIRSIFSEDGEFYPQLFLDMS